MVKVVNFSIRKCVQNVSRALVHHTYITLTLIPAAAFHQFHQYYIHGKFSSCKEQKERMYNCYRWRGLRKESAKVCQ